MSTTTSGCRLPSPVIGAITVRRRRLALAILQDRTAPVAERELATHVAAAEAEKPLIDVTREEVAAIHADLHHVHLPRLEAASLVERDFEERRVTTTSHPALDDPHLETIVGTDAEDWDGVLEGLTSERRRTVLAVLEGAGGPMAREVLAAAVARRETEADEQGRDSRSAGDGISDVLASLHHTHLPKLDEAGLVSYDADERTVVFEGHPDLDMEWLEFAPGETPRSVLPAARESPDIWTIEGRANVLEHGRSLVEQTDEELFLLFTTDGLLEPECFRVIEDAIERGVDVYLGSQTKAVRDQVRERTPEVVIWEPQLDWLNLPPDRERVGRLVFADRRAAMLATLGERNDDGVHAETAIAGTGESNGLVVLLRELLGPRLDHLDAQSEDFLSQIPF